MGVLWRTNHNPCWTLNNFFSSTKIHVIRYSCVGLPTTTRGRTRNPTSDIKANQIYYSNASQSYRIHTIYTSVPMRAALDSVSEGDAIIKDTNLSPSFCDARDRRICGFREIKGRKEKVQWLIVPKDSPTVQQGVPICSPRIFFFYLPSCK